uniref:Uncharacterized protein n=1 Tax=Anopheles funestus TaxID=62324 RepID=A0A182RV98_ANOFN
RKNQTPDPITGGEKIVFPLKNIPHPLTKRCIVACIIVRRKSTRIPTGPLSHSFLTLQGKPGTVDFVTQSQQ